MLTIDWKDLQCRKPNNKKKVKQEKGSQTVSVRYPLGKTNFSASDWEEYQQWVKQQKKQQRLQEKAQNELKSKKGKTTKSKKKKMSKKKSIDNKAAYKKQLEHPLWTRKRHVILERDQHKCCLCGSEFNLQVHHTQYRKGNKAWEYPNSTLVTLCKECHQKVHSDKTHTLYPSYHLS